MFLKPYVNVISRYFIRVVSEKSNLPFNSNAVKLNIRSFNLIAKCYKKYAINKNVVESGVHCDDDDDDSKMKLISKLNFKSEEDATPFYRLPMKSLLKIYNTTKVDEETGNCDNRLYYLAERLKCTPSHLSKCIARRTFIYSLSFDWLKASLDILLEMGVTEDRILRDLWVLKYHNKTIEERLLRVKRMGLDNVHPWMVRCSEKILERSVSISQETKTILGDIKSTKNYLANRLNTTPEAVEEMCFTIPALKQIRASKVKKFLDFLIEEGFEVEEIARKPRVISASQKTVMLRLDKLRQLGLTEINLNVLCRSRKDFKKYCESIESASDTKQT